MKSIIVLSFCLLLAGNELPAQTPLITYGSGWSYLDNGSNQGIAWRSSAFDDSFWKKGNGKFGYGATGITTQVDYGPDPAQKYITTYFRKTVFVTDPSGFTSFSAGVLRDDGIVVYVNGQEVYRNGMPTGAINYLTLGKDAADNGTVTQAFSINTAAFVNGNNVIAVEIHQKTVTNADLAFDLQLSGNTTPSDQTPPVVLSVNRQSPANEQTGAAAVTFRVTFSEKVKGVNGAAFRLFTSGGNVRGTLTSVGLTATAAALTDAVKAAGPDSTAYDVTVNALAGTGMLRLDVRDNSTGITDMAGNALNGGFTNGQAYTVIASPSGGFNSFVDLTPVPISRATKEITQAKVWTYAGKWWAVLPTSGGTKLFRLDNTSWTEILTITTSSNSRADCRVVGNLVHLLLFRGPASDSYFVSLEYDAATNTYKRWTQRTSNVAIVFEAGTVSVTLANDATGRMWIASNSNGNVLMRYSDAPYTTWSQPVTIASGAISEDICAVTALPGKTGVMWTDQNAHRFGFKTHDDGAGAAVWSANEVPAAQSALDVGNGMADDHLHLVAASDGTLYCAVKTGYDKPGLPTIALLVRRPGGAWDNLYPVTSSKEGNRPIVILNEAAGKVKVLYSTHLDHFDGSRSGEILYRESSTAAISFGPPVTLLSGKGDYSLEYTTSSHQPYDSTVVIIATNESVDPYNAVGILASDAGASQLIARETAGAALQAGNNENDKLFVRPNPFAASAIVELRLSQAGRYSVILFDSRGARVKMIGEGWASAGSRYLLSIDGTRLSSGPYYLKIQTEQQIRMCKLIRR